MVTSSWGDVYVRGVRNWVGGCSGNERELAYKQLRDLELQLKELRLEDNNIVDGLKVDGGCGDK